MKPIIKIHVLFIVLFLGFHNQLLAQNNYPIHSHNDYKQEFPFWNAYINKAASIEIDLFLKNEQLFVTHSEDEIITENTLEFLYLEPINKLEAIHNLRELQLLIDIKSEAYTTLYKVIEVLKEYPNLFENKKIQVVISGNRPKPKDYPNYPDFIKFDHQNLDDLNEIDLTKVALISVDYKDYAVWNGYGRMTTADLDNVKSAIKKAHDTGKPFRFWATPDTKTAWTYFAKLDVDFINTDNPSEAYNYLKQIDKNTFVKEIPIEVYTPTYNYDSNTAPMNVILMIGDGNGLAQISSAMIANHGALTLNGIKNIGLVKTNSADNLITDSAAGATAMATGLKTNNRAIGVNPKGEKLNNLIEILSKKNFNTAIVTTDAIYGATPASFYAHRIERDDTQGILNDLKDSSLNFFIAGGKQEEKSINSKFITKNLDDFMDVNQPTAVYFGDNKMPAIANGRADFFLKSIKKSLEALSAKNTPFFLLVEGAQIDNGGHSNSIADIVEELVDFDQAVAEALRFADKTKNTLVIITADHETSGLGIVGGNEDLGIVQADFLTIDHTGIMVPIFAYGPGAQNFNGTYHNNAIFKKIIEVLTH